MRVVVRLISSLILSLLTIVAQFASGDSLIMEIGLTERLHILIQSFGQLFQVVVFFDYLPIAQLPEKQAGSISELGVASQNEAFIAAFNALLNEQSSK